MIKLKIEEIFVLIGGQNDNDPILSKKRRICSRCKRKRYIKCLRLAECEKCVVCRNKSRCKSKLFG